MKTIAIGIVSLFALLTPGAFAQVGSNSPDGVAGGFQGEITTGCSYDPYTLTARREITDISVSGSVGTYPLAFTRTATSRYNTGVSADFGAAGSWQHSYQWSINTDKRGQGSAPTSYAVNFPDGGLMVFSSNSDQGNIYGDPYFRSGIENPYRLQVIWDTQTSGRLWLIRPDGGKVYFTGQRTHPNNYYFFTYTLQSITDPYGQTTTVTGSSTNSPVTVTEPAGRWIKMYYRTITSSAEGALNDIVIDHVAASDGRSVQYNYTAYVTQNLTTYTSLTSVVYYGDPTLTATYAYQDSNLAGPASGRPLLSRCFDPMYMGAMVRIAYIYTYGSGPNPDGTAVVAGQLQSENYFDGTTVGPAVSTISILPNGPYNRQETTGDGRTRKFLIGFAWTPKAGDFKGVDALQNVDMTYYWVNSHTDRNGNTTNWTNTALTGRPVQVSYPLTPNDTPPGTPRGTVTYTYGSATCPDPNNRDANNPYYLYSTTDEGGHTTVFLRDANKRIIQTSYPDGGTESFTYNSFGQVLTHLMRTGGTETFSYDARGLQQTYRDAYHATGNPSFWYQYDSLDRISGITGALGSGPGDINHCTSFTYNSRSQLLTTTHPVDPIDGQRHSIINSYNQPVGTLASVTDELGHVSSYSYDDYRRIRSLTSPGHNTPLTGYMFYDASGVGDDYTHTDANVTHSTSPAGKKIGTVYDADKRRISITIGTDTVDAATTSLGYDNNGNLTSAVSPNEQPGQLYAGFSTTRAYDERNRSMSMTDALGNVATFKYDAANRRASTTRPNGQVTTYDSYDPMNRLLQQTVKQTPNPDGVTKYTYYTSGLLNTMQDPRLVAINSSETYIYQYDSMGRKTSLTYPRPTPSATPTSESWHYDTAGRLDTFTNRAGTVKTIARDPLNRITGFSWNDGITPGVAFGYDVAARVTSVINSNSTILRGYFSDSLLYTETVTYADHTPRTVTYTYDADGKKKTILYPGSAYSITYNYTNRDQLQSLVNNAGSNVVATFGYDLDGNVISRAPDNGTTSAYVYDAVDRATHITHALNGTTRAFDYAYDSVGNRKWTKRDNSSGDVFGYDLNDQSVSVLLNVANPDTTGPGSQTISYDANGNRAVFSPYGVSDSYTTNNLNQYTVRNSISASYDNSGNMTANFDGSAYSYDAQKSLLSATKSGTDEVFTYDGLNRQASRTVNGTTTYNIYDGWSLIAEYAPGAGSPSTAYLFAAGGMLKNLTTNRYYYQDASGSTTHLADNSGHLLEWYRYDLQGTPIFSGGGNSSAFGVRHLFSGQQWYSELALYDLRHRFYSPDLGRFLQADPIGFAGDGTNLYRHLRNNPLKGADLLGLCDNSNDCKLPEQGGDSGGGDPGGSGTPAAGNAPDDSYNATTGEQGNPNGQSAPLGAASTDSNGLATQTDPLVVGIPTFGDNNAATSGTSDSSPETGSTSGVAAGPSGTATGSDATGSGPMGSGPMGSGISVGTDSGGSPGGFAIATPGGINSGAPPGVPGGGIGFPAAVKSNGSHSAPGQFIVPWWPSWLELPYSRPATAEEIAWTKSGFWPTVIIGTTIFAPELLEFTLPLGGYGTAAALPAHAPSFLIATYGTAVIGTATWNPAAAEQYLQEPYEVWIVEWIIEGGK